LLRNRIFILAGCLVAGGWAQDGPRYFELLLPDFSDQPFAGGPTTIEHPPKPLERMSIQVLNPYADTIAYGSIFVKVNGKGLGNAFERRANAKGKILLMTPATLHARPDELFDARENAIEVRAVDPRGRTFYQDWVLRASEPGRNEFFSYSTTLAADNPQGIPPDLVLTEPSTPIAIRGGAAIRVKVKGTVSSKDPGAEVFVNGKPLVPPIAGNSQDFDLQVPVDRSLKTLVIEAVDKRGDRRSVTIPVVVPPPMRTKPKFAGNRYAVVVGISRFGDRKGAPPLLAGAAVDAGEFAKELQASSGFSAQNTRVLLDDKATLDQVKLALGDFAAQAKGNDLVVIYIATHGLHDPFHPDQLYLATYGTQMDSIDTTALPLGDLETLVDSRVRCNNVLLLFDVGHKLDSEYKFPSKNLVNNHLLTLFSGQDGRAVMVSAATDEVSMQRAATGEVSSMFTYWVTQGLSGKADVNYDGVVTADELFRFTAEKVREESNNQQTPRFRLAQRDDLQIAAAR
jgi:hypothetical protein